MILSPHSFLIILLSYIPLSCIWETLFVAQWPPFFMTRIYTQPLLQTALLGGAVPDIIGYTIVIWVISIYIYIYIYISMYTYIYICVYIYINNPNCTPHWLPPFSPGSPGWWLDIRLLMAHLLRRMLGTRTIKQPMVSNLGMATMGICIRKGTYTHMVPSQNCVWNVPRCSGRMERRGFVTGLVPDLWSVMKYRLYINK